MTSIVGRRAAKVQPRYLIVAASPIITPSICHLTTVYGDLSFWLMNSARNAGGSHRYIGSSNVLAQTSNLAYTVAF
jgi:hypothetical protein